jgi:two-component system nitrogen regulation response regulator NtrX
MPDVVLLDLVLADGDLDGLEVLARTRALNAELPIIIMTGHACVETAVEAMKLGASDYVQKPLNIDEVLLLIDRSIEVVNLRRELDRLRNARAVPADLSISHIVEKHPEGDVYDGVLRQLLIEALQRAGGNKARACRWLRLTKSRFDYRLRQYGISATQMRKEGRFG